MIERGGRSRERGEAVQGPARQRLPGWPRVREGTWAQRTLASSMWPVRQAGERLLAAGQPCGGPKTEGTGRALRKRRQALWTVVRHAGGAPPTHAAERAIRPGGLWRQGSLGTQSAAGSRCVEALRTGVATLKPPPRHVLASVTAACEAALCGPPAPSVLPTPADLDQGMRPAA